MNVAGALVAVIGTYGAFLLYSALVFGWTGVGVGPAPARRNSSRMRAEKWLAEAGLEDVRLSEFVGVMTLLFMLGCGITYGVFGAVAPALAVGAFAATFPCASYRSRRQRRRQRASEAWPRMIEEIALLTGSLGRSIPQAVFEVGRNSPVEMQPAFAAAQREWLISTDFGRSLAVLKIRLADATADATCETLLVAHEVGGTEVSRRLAALVEDRVADLHGRKDAHAKQAGVKFARKFVLFVPIGMALAGLSIGDGRAAYRTVGGQVGALVAIAMVVACWLWSGRIMRLPEEERVFHE